MDRIIVPVRSGHKPEYVAVKPFCQALAITLRIVGMIANAQILDAIIAARLHIWPEIAEGLPEVIRVVEKYKKRKRWKRKKKQISSRLLWRS
jgi:hypothetical protein